MSDRIAVFNERPDRAGRHPRRRSTSTRRPPFVAGFVGTSNLLAGRRRAAAARRRTARSASGRRRSGSSTPDAGPAPARSSADGRGPRGRLRRPATRYRRRPRRRRRRWSPCDRTRATATSQPAGDRAAGAAGSRSGLCDERHVVPRDRADATPARGRQDMTRRDHAARSARRVGAARAGRRAAAMTPRRQRRERRRERPRRPSPRRTLKALDTLGDREGEVNIVAWAGYAEDGTTDPNVDWVTPFEEETGCKVNVKIGADLRRDGQPDEDRPVRRRVGVRRRVAAADRVRRRRAGEHRPGAQLRRRLRRA